jgi:glycosyltransferase involved in cell wall biosynthesis
VPSFSVVIAAYNAAETIGEAVESALGQTLAPKEIVVCDDGSTDETEAALEPYRDRIVSLRQENGGAPSALNAAVRAATGDFVCPLDSDDVYEPDRIRALGELGAARPDLDLLAADTYLERDGAVVGLFSDNTPFATSNQPTAIFERCFVVLPAMRRTRLLAIGGYDEGLRIAYDWDCYLRLLRAGASAGYVDRPLYRYRLRDDSLSGSRAPALRDRVALLEKVPRDLTPLERGALTRSLRVHRSRAVTAEAEEALRQRRPDARRRALAAARTAGVPRGTRLKALVAALAPGVVADRLEAEEARTGRTRLKRPIPRG